MQQQGNGNGVAPDTVQVLRNKVRDLIAERNEAAARAAELEAAIAPLAKVLIEWGDKPLPETLTIPAAVVVNAAKVHAGTA